MNIFGLCITTKKNQAAYIEQHDNQIKALNTELTELADELMDLREQFIA